MVSFGGIARILAGEMQFVKGMSGRFFSLIVGFIVVFGLEALAQAAGPELPRAYWMHAMQAPATTIAAAGGLPTSSPQSAADPREAEWPVWLGTLILIAVASWIHARMTTKERIVLHTEKSHLGAMRAERSRARALTVTVVRQGAQSSSTSDGPIRMP